MEQPVPGLRAGTVSDGRDRDLHPMEINHRLANSLQLAAVMLRQASRRVRTVEEARDALDDAAARMLAVGRMHRQLTLHHDDGDVDLAEFLRPFADDLRDSIGAGLDFDCPGIAVPADTATQLGIVLNELALNAVKHGAQDGKDIAVSLRGRRGDNGCLRLTVEDDGVGLKPDFSPLNSQGLGMQVIRSTITKLGGKMWIGDGRGACFEFELPQS